MLPTLEKLEIPDFTDFTDLQLLHYIDTEVRKYSIDKEASRQIKQAMEPAVLSKIQELLNQGVLENIVRLNNLIQIYGFTRTGVMFNPVYLGLDKTIETSELILRVEDFFRNDPSTYNYEDFAIVLGYVSLLFKRIMDF